MIDYSKFSYFLNTVQKKISGVFNNWKKDKKEKNDDFDILCSKIMSKIMDGDFKSEKTLRQMQSILYDCIKR
jgi:hypothetical protein